MNIESPHRLLIQAEHAYAEATSDPRRGLALAGIAVEAAREVDAAEALVVALRAAGYAARDLYDHDEARRCLNEAADVARRRHLSERLCEVLITSSATWLELGEPRRARRDLREARVVASPRLRPEVDFAEALLEDTTGNLASAAAAYRRALRNMDAGNSDNGVLRVKTLNNLALVVTMFGQYVEAELLLEQAIELAHTRWKAREAVATESYAIVAVESGRPVEALRRYEHAERLLTDVGVQLVELYRGKARALLTLQLLDEAADAAARAVELVDGVPGGSLMLAEVLLPQARVALAQDRLDDAVVVATRAERLFRQQRRRGWRAEAALLGAMAQARIGPTEGTVAQLDRVERTMVEIGNAPGVVEAALLQGDVSSALGRPRKAKSAYRRAAAAAGNGTALLRLQGRRAQARYAELSGETRRLGQICRLGLDELTAYRASLSSAELRARAASHGMALADIGLRAALRSGRPEQIWAWLERSSSVVFISGSSLSNDHLQPVLAQLRSLEREQQEMPPGAVDSARVLRRIAALEREIRRATWTAARSRDGWTRPSVQALRTLRARLGDRVLLQYGIADGRVHAVAVRPDRLQFADIGALAGVVDAGRRLGVSLRRLTQPHRSSAGRELAFDGARSDMQYLSDTLLGPFGGAIHSGAEILVAPPSRLIGLPWGSLALVADRPVRVVPSALSWWFSRTRGPVEDRTVVVAGPDLRHADDEARRVARCHDGVVVLTGPDASSDAVRAAADGAARVHVAAHGRLRSDSPTFSSIRLADGPLTVHDLESLGSPAHHWVLATCDLGRPGTLAGPALEGVVATLLARGSGAVIAATVSVPDVDTRDLMVELHRRLAAGGSMAESLRRARVAVDPSTPSGFVAGTAFTCYGGG